MLKFLSNQNWNTNQETRQATVELNIVEDDENVTSKPGCTIKLCFFFMVLVVCFLVGGYVFLIYYMFSLQTTASKIFGWILLSIMISWISSCIVFFSDTVWPEPI